MVIYLVDFGCPVIKAFDWFGNRWKGFCQLFYLVNIPSVLIPRRKDMLGELRPPPSQLIDIVREHGNNKGRPGNFLVWLSLILVLKNLFNLHVMPEVCKHGKWSVLMEITHFWCSYQVCMRSNHWYQRPWIICDAVVSRWLIYSHKNIQIKHISHACRTKYRVIYDRSKDF